MLLGQALRGAATDEPAYDPLLAPVEPDHEVW